jgi:cytochrome c oxidase subunit III
MSHPATLAHQFDDVKQQRETTTLGMWLFLITEVMFFGGLFLGYAVYRVMYPEAYVEGSHHLDIVWGTFNTVVLIASSLTMAMAVHASSLGRKSQVIRYLLLTMFLGLVFLGVKAIEYSHKFHEHLVPGPHFAGHGANAGPLEIYFSFYFAMTGMHALHMVIGIVALTVLVIMTARGRFSSEYSTPVEFTGLYWHFVDIVWIFLFPLLYLIGRHA